VYEVNKDNVVNEKKNIFDLKVTQDGRHDMRATRQFEDQWSLRR